VTLVSTLNFGGVPFLEDVYVTGAFGWDDSVRTVERERSMVEVLYIPTFCADDGGPRAGIGFRAERVTGPNTFPAYIPFFVLSLPNESYTFLLQTEYREQENNRVFFLDLSAIF